MNENATVPPANDRNDRLDFDLHMPTGATDGSVVAVLLHGRGSHKGDLQALVPMLPPDWVVITPQAPFPGAPWGYGQGWAWYRYAGENRLVEETLEESLGLLDGFLATLPETLGFTPGPIVLGGFSQGGTTSITYALTRPGALKAALNFSGFVHASLELPTGSAATEATPIFWGHGTRDANIPFHMAISGREALNEAGIPVVHADYDIGHWILPEEVHEAIAMVASLG